jgi:hypothetical protein
MVGVETLNSETFFCGDSRRTWSEAGFLQPPEDLSCAHQFAAGSRIAQAVM